MKLFTLILALIFTSQLFAQAPMLKATPYKYVQSAIGKGKAHFIELGSDSCHSCQIMGRELYKVKQKNPAFNIEFINVKHERQAAYDFKIRMIPTQIIFDATGKEVYRHIGLLESKELSQLFKTYNF